MRGETSDFRQRLKEWFAGQKRELPWRTRPSLYKTVVSEFMLQQTQVGTVKPYFERWLESFPDFATLAGAEEENVLKHWEGLGYYSRARNLHKLARSIVAAGIPETVEEWRQRPGIGPYTAAAISSIAQGLPEPVIDGNVIRVLSRLSNDAVPVRSSAEAQKRYRPLAARLIDPANPGEHNEALMELGATLCRKHRPLCLLCPVRPHCEACAAGTQETLPVIARKSSSRREIARLWAQKDGKLLLHFYPDTARRLAGMAELPELAGPPREKPLLERSRGISSEQIRESIFRLPPDDPILKACAASPNAKWVATAQLDEISLSAPHRRWIRQILKQLG